MRATPKSAAEIMLFWSSSGPFSYILNCLWAFNKLCIPCYILPKSQVCTGRVLASTIRKNIYSHAGLSSATPVPRGIFPQALADLSSL